MRLAVKLAYDGTRFHGNQIQPGLRTVHSEVEAAMRKLAEDPGPLRWAGRTDGGVSAVGNVVVFRSQRPPASLLPAMTYRMEDAWAWAWAEVPDDFEPRHASRRHYRYHLRSGVDVGRFHEALTVFHGTHDFSSFARVEPGVEPVRTVSDVRVERQGPFLVVDVTGENFLWNQVRRMVEAARRVAAGEVQLAEVRAALAGETRDFGMAAPEPLVLMDVAYPRVVFQPFPDRVHGRIFGRLRRRVEEREDELRVLATLLVDGPEGRA